MQIKMKFDEISEIPPMEMNCSEINGIKTFWNVDLLKRDAPRKQKKTFSVRELYNPDNEVDEEYAMTTNIEAPIIITKIGNDSYSILDGKHRLYKAKMLGEKEIWAYVIEQEEQDKYIINIGK